MVIGATIIARQATNMLNIGIQPTQMCCLPKKQGNWLEQMVWCKQNTHTHIQVFKWALMFYRHDLLSKVGNHVQVTVQTHWYVISQNWPLPESPNSFGTTMQWLVVWNIVFSIYWEYHHPNWLIFFRGVAQPPTRQFHLCDFPTCTGAAYTLTVVTLLL